MEHNHKIESMTRVKHKELTQARTRYCNTASLSNTKLANSHRTKKLSVFSMRTEYLDIEGSSSEVEETKLMTVPTPSEIAEATAKTEPLKTRKKTIPEEPKEHDKSKESKRKMPEKVMKDLSLKLNNFSFLTKQEE
eukprot:maker-scaffold_6-snap-gene-10.6-mRNA-1 protein AED:0.06 eAED:0.06 QI:0/0/0.33/0.66/0/0/3/155/135